ncbi:putative metaphase-anaphase transition protein (Mlo2) [Aspergillus undulatus]|uniref:putative metaphase-anaphase transition protein (Mlo2) n=1 Tax=Aspergillus undulatus TaxID=1810928 RepID=UPI003CCC9C81
MSNDETAAVPTVAPTGNGLDAGNRRASFSSQNSQTAKEFLESQMRLEADAREVLPYSFDSCSQNLGPLRQSLFACLTCNPATPDAPYTAAGVCYSCSIACHGEHTLVELFNKRNFVCDCGTTRIVASTPCTLRVDAKTGAKGVKSEEPHPHNRYNDNFKNKFCGCGEDYNAHEEKGTMFQCLGLGTTETGGCGEDWWHPECLIGLPRSWYQDAKKKENADNCTLDEQDEEETPLPPGFPAEDDFETFLCYKCVESNPWLKQYAGTPGFLPPVFKQGGLQQPVKEESAPAAEHLSAQAENQPSDNPKKRKAEDDTENETNKGPASKRPKEEPQPIPPPSESKPDLEQKQQQEQDQEQPPKHTTFPSTPPPAPFSLFLKEDFRNYLCRCPTCYPNLAPHPQLREEEETYEPPLSENGGGAPGSTGTGSIYDRGEAALSNIDRVRAIEGAMVYNHLRDKVKDFLRPFAESGTAVGADDIKAYFEKLRGDEGGIRDAKSRADADALGGGGGNGDDESGNGNGNGDARHEQSGKLLNMNILVTIYLF